MTTTLQTPETAPKDGTPLLGDFQGHCFMLAAWCPLKRQWVIASHYPVYHGNTLHKVAFENRYEPHSKMVGWLPVPEVEQFDEGEK